MIAAAQIEQMTLAERMEAMELLWRSISSEPASVVSPAWHGEVLQKRLARIKAGKAKFLTVGQLKKRLGKRRG
jgi:putative addiction module component (TIGR02574 family)